MLMTHLPALQVVMPLVSAPVCLLLRDARHAWACALLVSTLALATAVLILQQVYTGGTVSYAIGAWAAPIGIEYRIDMTAALLLFIITVVAVLVMVFAKDSVCREISSRHCTLFYTCFLLCLAGLLGIVVTGDTFNLFVFLEISSLSSYVLISMGSSRRALTAAYQYLIMGTIGATFILLGIGFLYMLTGTLNMADLSGRLAELPDSRTIRVAFAFVTVGVSIKLALFPLHLWLPNAYTFAPSAVSAFVAATATKAAIYVLLRFFYTLFGAEFSFAAMHAGDILMLLAVAAVLVASLVAVYQNDVKRMLSYSSVAQIGYIILGISLASSAGVSAGIIHLFNHALIKGALFLSLGCVFLRLGSTELRDMRGLARQMPWTMTAFVIGGLSLIGMPLTAGFISKWYLVLAVLDRGYWPLAVVILAGSLLALVYIWRVVEAVWFHSPTAVSQRASEVPAFMLVPTWILIAMNLYVGMNAGLLHDMAVQGAQQLAGHAAP